MLIVVARTDHAKYAYLKHAFARDDIEVILDRRLGERRERRAPAATQRRRQDRRQREVSKDLEAFGWAVVRHSER